MNYGPQWRTHRRMFHQQFYETTVSKYRPMQQRQVRAFLARMLHPTADVRQRVRQYVRHNKTVLHS